MTCPRSYIARKWQNWDWNPVQFLDKFREFNFTQPRADSENWLFKKVISQGLLNNLKESLEKLGDDRSRNSYQRHSSVGDIPPLGEKSTLVLLHQLKARLPDEWNLKKMSLWETHWYQWCKGRSRTRLGTSRCGWGLDMQEKVLDQDLLISFTTNRARCLLHLQALILHFWIAWCLPSCWWATSPISTYVCMQACVCIFIDPIKIYWVPFECQASC